MGAHSNLGQIFYKLIYGNLFSDLGSGGGGGGGRKKNDQLTGHFQSFFSFFFFFNISRANSKTSTW